MAGKQAEHAAASVPQDPPSGAQLLQAVSQFLRGELAPELHANHRLRFRTLVAANLLDLLLRQEASTDLLHWRALWCRLGELTGETNEALPADAQLGEAIVARQRRLVDRIRAGTAPTGTVDLLREVITGQVTVANPRYAENFEPR